ncbi:hypothetical protein ARC78_03825 [Stenotrophomonas pictorum JCM 9942]|uniref:Uncharacterized protein n=2 Tax=Stenotrophomonas pictorum TaxID=86184 RepID=A0A0R0AJ10_9GAMM|nr:hypothetical protein [Stenotrophomonas pictorum]KRG44949.1 hypothetical protein ARC78_03825 [Stenotrophomonas pictorum JCM 9942]
MMKAAAVLILLTALPLPVLAASAKPEIERPAGSAQADGAVHTVRQIPEACTRIEGRFTGDAASPYDMQLVRTSAQCQPRAVFLDFARVTPSEAAGWKLNEVVRIPSAACRSRQAQVEVWRKPAGQQVALDGQGQSRVYLGDAKTQAAAGKLAALPAYSARLSVEGAACTR